MLRQLGFIGSLAVFSVLAFVPPGEGQAAYIKEKGSILPRNIAFQDMDAVVPLVTERLSQIDKKEVFHQATSVATSFIGFAAKNMNTTVHQSNSSSEQWRTVASSSDEQTRSRFLSIEWAREQHDRVACDHLSRVDLSAGTTADEGDWIAFCFARVTDNESRCEQITAGRIPDLKTLCENEVTDHIGTLTFLATLLP